MRLRRVGNAVLVFLVLMSVMSAAAFAEGPGLGLASSTPRTGTFYESSVSLVDNSGNLVVVDEGFTVTAVATTTTTSSFVRTRTVRTPSTRITVIRAGGVTNTVEYATDIDVIGAGTKAVYAFIDGDTSRTLVAILTDQSLPSSATSFPSLTLTDNADVRRTSADTFAVVDPPAQPSSSGTTTRTAKIVSFNGTAFVVGNQANIP